MFRLDSVIESDFWCATLIPSSRCLSAVDNAGKRNNSLHAPRSLASCSIFVASEHVQNTPLKKKMTSVPNLPPSQISWTPAGGASVQWACVDKPASRSSGPFQVPRHCIPTSSHRWSHYDLPCGDTRVLYKYIWLNLTRRLILQIVAYNCKKGIL